MIWIASFPRSGNTFLRNILYEVYGLESSTFHKDPDYHHDENYERYPFVKTHLLPEELVPSDLSDRAIYIVRDGRDALCSIAHHRKDIIAPGSDYYENLKAAIIAEKGTFFGGWSVNVRKWINRAELILRYEDLVSDPIKTAEKIRQVYDLPDPDIKKMPSFKQMKHGLPRYGSGIGRNLSEKEMRDLAEKNFRKGKTGSWKEEMPEELFDLFWSYHGETMEMMGYSREGEIVPPHPDLDYLVIRKLGLPAPEGKPERKILIEGNKLVSNDNDGIKRYQVELLKGLYRVVQNPYSRWKIDLYINGEIKQLKDYRDLLFNDFNKRDTLHRDKAPGVSKKPIFQRIEEFLVNLVPDKFVMYLKKHNINIFHRTYGFIKRFVFKIIEIIIRTCRWIVNLVYQAKNMVMDELVTSRQEKVFQEYDLVHLPLKQHYQPFRRTRVKTLITFHDLTHRLFPHYHTSINISNAEKGLRFAIKKNAEIIAVSGSTRDDIVRECGIPPERVHMIYEAAEKDKFRFMINTEDTARVREKYGIPLDSRFLFCLSTIEPRKNIENTILAFSKLLELKPGMNVNLVVAGKKGWILNKFYLQDKALDRRIIFTGFVDDSDLSALYSDAAAFCYISYYEGFGLPPLEAMNCKTPVIFGNNSSMPEIIGKGGLPADPSDIDDMMNKMLRILTDEELRNELSRNALKRSLDFSWRKTVIQTLHLYDTIIS